MSSAVPAGVPTLGRRDVTDELLRLHAGQRRSPHTALFGQADRDLQLEAWVEARYGGQSTRFKVAEVHSELALRKALSSAAADEKLLLLVTYGLDVPNDIAARIAKGQVLQIERARRVAARFQARGVSAEVLAEKPLVDALLDEGGDFDPAPGLVVELGSAWRALLRRLTAVGTLDLASDEKIVAFAATAGGGPELARRLSRWPELGPRLHAWIERTAGRVARIAWRAWERDQGVTIAALAFVFDAVGPDLSGNGFLRGRLASVLEALDVSLAGAEADRELLSAWGRLAPRLSFQLEAARGLQPVLAEAARILPADPEVQSALARSRYLPQAFELAQAALAHALRESLARPGDRSALGAAVDAAQRLEQHRLSHTEANRFVIERSRMALRLLAWRELSGRSALQKAMDATPAERVALLAAWYASEGAFVDHARRAARGGIGDELGGAIAAVLDAAGEIRAAYDEAFATALPAWLGRGRATSGAVAIDEALERFAVPFLAASKGRKLLVLLLDGMAWANACELLLDMEGHGFAPIAHQLSRDGLRLLEPMIAAVPSVTEVSRSAFFAGRLPRAGETVSTSGDPDRFGSHKALLGVLDGRSPRLLLSPDVDDPSGGASNKARDLVESDERVVGVVLNAIDDRLRASPQARYRTGVDDIRPLRDLLMSARASNRAILLVSDHGHVPGARLETVAGIHGAGSRWRPLSEGQATREREVALSGDRVWRPRGQERVALLWSETESYSSAAREGEHGGASLAELVAPAVFVAHEALAAVLRKEGDPSADALEATAYPKPRFWSLDLPKETAAPAPLRKAREPKPPTAQVAMPFAPSAVPAPKPGAAALAVPPEVTMLAQSPVFKAMLERRPKLKERKDLVLKAVGALFEAEGRLAPDLFATRTGTLVTRVAGAVAIVQEALNVDGLPVLVYDAQEKLVKLDRDTFRAIFGKDE
jgi:hypothetical protein